MQVKDDLISRQTAIDALRDARHTFTVADEAGGMGTVKWSEDVIYFAAAENVIADLPSAEPKTRECERDRAIPRGKWIWVSSTYDRVPCESRYQCSHCHHETITHGREPWEKFCPNCGSRMRGETDD